MTEISWPLMINNIEREDLDLLIEHLKQDDPKLTHGPKVEEFEKKWSEWLGVEYSLMLNSGSSANDLTMLALREMRRVTKPGGSLVVCEFSHPTWRPFRTVYMEYLMKALPWVATKVSSDPEAYVYLAESIRAWPTQPELAALIEQAGWRQCTWRNLTGGIVALHRAVV